MRKTGRVIDSMGIISYLTILLTSILPYCFFYFKSIITKKNISLYTNVTNSRLFFFIFLCKSVDFLSNFGKRKIIRSNH
ncbi:hypothetical protein J3Q64DRAFT_1759505 [Phycomyces blakesleeanus]|uniref:Uncharacterized protein n=1 Tax=Phycomyces blakesleeanus TaxID=4837 RepID=A0ABR3ASA5_PHYBL